MVESARHDEDRRRAYEAKRAVNPLPPIVECALQRMKDGEHLEVAAEWALEWCRHASTSGGGCVDASGGSLIGECTRPRATVPVARGYGTGDPDQ